MTSDAHRFEGHQGESWSAMTGPQQSEQVTELHSPAMEEDQHGIAPPLSATSECVGPALSAGYIIIQGGASAHAGKPADPHTNEAFENLERDLAALASACSELGTAEPGCAEAVEPLPPAFGASSADLALAGAETATTTLDMLPLPEQALVHESHTADAATTSLASESISHVSHKEFPAMNAQAQPTNHDAVPARAPVVSDVAPRQSSALETDGVLQDVQSTLDSLAGMAHGLSQQKLEMLKMREALEERRLATLERERQLAEREELLSQQEQRLQEEKQGIERVAEHNAAVLAERSSALQALAETVDSRDRATTKRAEVLSQEQQSIDRQLNQLRARAQDMDDREAGLHRQGAELAERFKQLLDAKERFGAIVKGFNETVRFNTTYSAISKTMSPSEGEV